MKNFIIKPDGLFPSTYSQMGRVLIPSKDCNNKKIARKFTEKGNKLKIDIFGFKTISAPYISTFKRFDRPTPLISQDCQNCQMLSVPSVTDKTIYPCSLGKYSVTEHSVTENKIGVLGNSTHPRITTSDYQLYQQYRVTEKNNIIDNDCCEFNLENGIYLSLDPQFEFLPIFYKNCDFCEVYNQGLIPAEDFSLEKIGICSFKLIINGIEVILNIIDDNTLEANIPSNPSIIFIKEESEPLSSIINSVNTFSLSLSGICGNISITDITFNGSTLKFKENGKLLSFTEGVEISSTNECIVNNGDDFYRLKKNVDRYKLVQKINCDCLWSLESCPCEFNLESGVYSNPDNFIIPLYGIVYKNCELCIALNTFNTKIEPNGICEWKVTIIQTINTVLFLKIIDNNKLKISDPSIPLESESTFIKEKSLLGIEILEESRNLSSTSPSCDNLDIDIIWDNSEGKITIIDNKNMVILVETKKGTFSINTITLENFIDIFDGDETFYQFVLDANKYVIVNVYNCSCRWFRQL